MMAVRTWGVLILLVIVPFFAYAQSESDSEDLERTITITATPEFPAPQETVALEARSYSIDLARSVVVWYANGKEIARGNGLTRASVTVGKLGSATNIEVRAGEVSGLLGSGEAVLRPSEVDLLWESNSYAPPYFQGRKLAGAGATIRAQAIARLVKADGSHIPENNIVYSWYKGTTRIASGRGQSSISFPGPALFANETVRVVAESVDGLHRGQTSVTLSGVDPLIELYENHPLFGVLYHRALTGSAATLEREQQVTAVPYFAAVSSTRDTSLVYSWSLNDVELRPDPEYPENFTISTQGYSGPVKVGLTLTSTSDWLLRAKGAWELVFGEEASLFDSNPFGRQQL